MATGKCRPANVNRQVFVSKLSQRVSICPNMSHRVPNSSFCWRQANVCKQMSTVSAFVNKLSQRVSICLNMSHRVPNSSFCWRLASVGRQMSTVKCLSANCLKESQPVPACLTESQTVASVGDRQVSTGKCQQASCTVRRQTVPTCLNMS